MTDTNLPGAGARTPDQDRRLRARSWFEELRDRICAEFEKLETELPDGLPHDDMPPGRFERTAWRR